MPTAWRSDSRGVIAYAAGIVLVAYGANGFFHHTVTGLTLRSLPGLYVVGFYVMCGVVLPAVFLGWLAATGAASPRWLGVQPGWRDVWASLAGLVFGAVLAAIPLGQHLQKLGGLCTAHRLFALLTVPSMAEVLIFLGVLGNAVHLAFGRRSEWQAVLTTGALSSLAFGLFHLTYPSPWNTLPTSFALTVVWLGVSCVFLATRSIAAAVVFNNVMALIGLFQYGVELPGTPAWGWLSTAFAAAVFSAVFRHVRGDFATNARKRL